VADHEPFCEKVCQRYARIFEAAFYDPSVCRRLDGYVRGFVDCLAPKGDSNTSKAAVRHVSNSMAGAGRVLTVETEGD